MGIKVLNFTNKGTKKTKEIHVGSVGAYVYELTKDVKAVNEAIRWCNKHDIGERFDCDAYSIEIMGFC